MIKHLLKPLRGAQRSRLILMQQAQELGLERAGHIAARLLHERLEPVALLPWQHKTLAALLMTLCDYEQVAGQPNLPAPHNTQALERTLDFIAQMPEHTQRKLSCVIALLEAAPKAASPLDDPSDKRRFSHLEPAARAALLARWESSPIEGLRAAFHGLKAACMMGYWSQPEVWPAAGYTLDLAPGDRPWVGGGVDDEEKTHQEEPS